MRPPFGDPEAAGGVDHNPRRRSLNPMVVVSADLAPRVPIPRGGSADATLFGVDASRAALERVIDYAVQQHLIPRRFEVDDRFATTLRMTCPRT